MVVGVERASSARSVARGGGSAGEWRGGER